MFKDGNEKEFMKFDGKKNRLELIEPEFIEGLGRILSFGAEKYEADNWKKANSPEDQRRIYGALQRHLLAYRKGEKIDPETGESHLYHACCNLMFLDYQDRAVGKEPNSKPSGFTDEQSPVEKGTTEDFAFKTGVCGEYRYLPTERAKQSQEIEDFLEGSRYNFMGYGIEGTGDAGRILVYIGNTPHWAFKDVARLKETIGRLMKK